MSTSVKRVNTVIEAELEYSRTSLWFVNNHPLWATALPKYTFSLHYILVLVYFISLGVLVCACLHFYFLTSLSSCACLAWLTWKHWPPVHGPPLWTDYMDSHYRWSMDFPIDTSMDYRKNRLNIIIKISLVDCLIDLSYRWNFVCCAMQI